MRTFDRSLPMSLLRARESVMQAFIPHLKEHGLSPQQWRVLRALFESEGMEMSLLSEQCYLLMPSLSRIVQNLEGRKLLQRRKPAEDQRRSVISLTKDGSDLVDLIAPQSEARYQHITEAFGYGKLELLYELLDDLVVALDDEVIKSSAGEL